LAKDDISRWHVKLPDKNLVYFIEETDHFDDYFYTVGSAQNFAKTNRDLVIKAVIEAIENTPSIPPFEAEIKSVNCHHNYVIKENYFGKNFLVTRKRAVSARKNDLGIIPGSMGEQSFIVRGLSKNDNFHSCSYAAGRLMSRAAAKR
jgi:tRNA-splicing ligase RtcB